MTDFEERMNLIELDLPTDNRTAPPVPAVPAPAPAPAAAPVARTNPLGIQPTVTGRAPVQQQPAPQPAPIDTRLRRGDIVAGAAAEGHGVMTGFGGRGTLTHAQLVQTLVGAGFPENWAPPVVSAHRHAGRAIGALNSIGYVARADRTKTQLRAQAKLVEQAKLLGESANTIGRSEIETALRSDTSAFAASVLSDLQKSESMPTWTARWYVQSTTRGAEVGQAAGRIVMVATLDENGVLQLSSSSDDLIARVREDYEKRVAEEQHSASDVSDWLKSTLVSRFRAAKLAGSWYIKRQHAANAEKLLSAFAAVWGENFMLPAIPVANSAQLMRGIAAAFAREVDDVLMDYREKCAEATAKKKTLSHRSSLAIHAKLRELTERCVGYAAMLGAGEIEPLRTKIVAASEEIEQTIDGPSMRYAAIFDELRRDAERNAR